MKNSYELVVLSTDIRGIVRFGPDPKKEAASGPKTTLIQSFPLGEKHGFVPGQAVKLTIES